MDVKAFSLFRNTLSKSGPARNEYGAETNKHYAKMAGPSTWMRHHWFVVELPETYFGGWRVIHYSKFLEKSELWHVWALTFVLASMILSCLFRQRRLSVPSPHTSSAFRARARSDSRSVDNRSAVLRFFERSSDSLRGFGGSRSTLHRTSSDFFCDDELFDPDDHFRAEEVPDLAGPAINNISYNTMSPPPRWSEASRSLLPQESRVSLYQEVSLVISCRPEVAIRDTPKTLNPGRKLKRKDLVRFRHSVADCSVHAKPPTGGGVVEIYVRDSPREDWKEHTFEAAAAASQFQLDLLALQLFGDAVFNIYQAFEIIHEGSMAHSGDELILHDERISVDKASAERCGAAWDDIMRCLGSAFPGVRSRLQAILYSLASSTPDAQSGSAKMKPEAPEQTTASRLTQLYEGKRCLLGPVDFFRLFVPLLPDTAIPLVKSSKSRMEQLLRWRKRVARASVLVNAYLKARCLANCGWILGDALPQNYLVRRLSFDEHYENTLHDLSAKNEYYEGTIARDIRCKVRGAIHQTDPLFNFDKVTSVDSEYQGYSLVGMHVFKVLPYDQDFQLHHERDPVLAIESLRNLIEQNPDLDFFVHTLFLEQMRVAVVKVFVRSLPVGVDSKFDSAVSSFVNGDKATRDQKLEILLQIGLDRSQLSVVAWAVFQWIAFLLRFLNIGRYKPVSQKSSTNSDVIRMPAIRLATCGYTCHFGGSLQSDKSLPNNYVSSTTQMTSERRNSTVTGILLGIIGGGGLMDDATDFTFVLSGNCEGELPERALGTLRLVHCDLERVALPLHYVARDGVDVENLVYSLPDSRLTQSMVTRWFRIFISDPVVGTARRLLSPRRIRHQAMPVFPTPGFPTRYYDEYSTIAYTDDPIEQAVNELIEILRDVHVPTIHPETEQDQRTRVDCVFKNSNDEIPVQQAAVLDKMSRDDVRRFFKGSDYNIEKALARIIEHAAWREATFPVDTRSCRIELQNGQFFQLGKDRERNPVLYFHNMCLGPWRKDDDAVIAAVLHRFDSLVQEYSEQNADVQFTLVILMGKPHRMSVQVKNRPDASEGMEEVPAEPSVEESNSYDGGETIETLAPTYVDSHESLWSNPRIPPDETWHVHTTRKLIERITTILLKHYPERLAKAFVVVGHGNTAYARTAVRAALELSLLLPKAARTRDKVKFLIRYRDLLGYIDKSELATIVGGAMPLPRRVFTSE